MNETISGTTKLIISILLIAVFYLIYSVTNYSYENYLVDRYIEEFKKKNDMLALENKKKMDDLLYFSSDEYRDKIGKQSWNNVNPGEKVIIIEKDPFVSPDEPYLFEESLFAREQEKTNPEMWWSFFFN